jgi:ABC-type Fe3+/spermidine/putrescine transport system ATPase subunit
VLVRLATGAVVGARSTPEIREGDAVAVSVRPENLRIQVTGVLNGPSHVKGTVREVVYVGSHNLVVVDIGQERSVVAHAPIGDNPTPGTTIALSFSGHHATALP